MFKILSLAERELRAYFYSPIAYVVMAAFLCLAGVFFDLFGDFVPGQAAQMRGLFSSLIFVLFVIIPVLTMHLVSEEMSRGTIETLMTAPVTDTQVILGKFLGAFIFYVLLLVPTLIYLAILVHYGEPELGPVLAGYLGLLLVGGLFIAVGLFTSVCTRVQIISAVMAVVFLGIMTILCNQLANYLPGPSRDEYHYTTLGQFFGSDLWGLYKHVDFRGFLQYVDFRGRYQNFAMGTIPLNDVVFFLSLTVLALFLSVKVLESRKWRA